MVIKSTDSGAGLAGFRSYFCNLLIGQKWLSFTESIQVWNHMEYIQHTGIDCSKSIFRNRF